MTVFNIYIMQLLKEKAVFLAKLQGLQFLSKVIEIIAKIENNFANNVK